MSGPLPWQWRIQVPITAVLLPQYRLELMPETVSLSGDEIGYTGQVLGCIWKRSGMLSASGLGFRLELMAEREKRTWSAVAIVSVFLLYACFISAVSGIYLQPFAILY